MLHELPVVAHPPLFRSRTHGMVDFSEDVSSKDVVNAAAEGFDSIHLRGSSQGVTDNRDVSVNARGYRHNKPRQSRGARQ